MIARVRKHPRVDSVSWRTFNWLVIREAAVGVLVQTYHVPMGPGLRAWIAKSSTTFLRRQVERLLADDPGRRYWP